MVRRFVLLVMMVALTLFPVSTLAQSTQKGRIMHAIGTFKVTMGKAEASDIGKSAGIGRMTIDKVWSGTIEGTSKGEMLASSEANGAMAYVALEKMTVKINGRSGTFVFTHGATMLANDPATGVLEVKVVPASGTGELQGIEGTLSITIDKNGHSYDFAYTLPGS
jgi:hypothetical protein